MVGVYSAPELESQMEIQEGCRRARTSGDTVLLPGLIPGIVGAEASRPTGG